MQLEQTKIRFGRFEILPRERELLANGEHVPLHARAFDLLSLLIEHRDRALSRDEIMTRVWGGLAVAPNNLSVQLSSLRKVLAEAGEEATLIQTLPGGCYRFIGDVQEAEAVVVPPVETPELPRQRRPLPTVVSGAALVLLFLAALSAIWLGMERHIVAPTSASLDRAFSPPPISIVVLPFNTLTDNRNLQYLADAIADDLTTALGRIVSSTVIARESAAIYRNNPTSLQQIGRTLNVRYAVEGSLRLSGTTYHVNVQLIDMATSRQLWGGTFDEPQDKMSALQDDIVRRIAAVLDARLLAQDVARSMRERPNDPQAIDFFLRGRYYYAAHDDLAGVTKAQDLFEQALLLSPDYVDALVALGQLLISKSGAYDYVDGPADLRRARQVIAHATELAPGDAKVLSAQADLQRGSGDLDEARASYEAALAVDPNNARAQMGLAACDWLLGLYVSQVAHLQSAARLDPLGPAANWRHGMLGMGQFMLGQYQDAIGSFEREIASVPAGNRNDDLGRVEYDRLFMMAAYALSGQAEKARQAWQDYDKIWRHRSVWRMLACLSGAQARTPGYARLREGLSEAGMPAYADVRNAQTISVADYRYTSGDFALTPATVPGAGTLDAAGVRNVLAGCTQCLVLDVGRGAAVIQGAIWNADITLPDTWSADQEIEKARSDPALLTHIMIVMGTGVYDPTGYVAVVSLIKAGFTKVFWFRGGEEAWAAAGQAYDDRRKP